MTMSTNDRIQAFFTGRLSPDELEAFLLEVQHDRALYEEVAADAVLRSGFKSLNIWPSTALTAGRRYMVFVAPFVTPHNDFVFGKLLERTFVGMRDVGIAPNVNTFYQFARADGTTHLLHPSTIMGVSELSSKVH